jgi:hypothetical protein
MMRVMTVNESDNGAHVALEVSGETTQRQIHAKVRSTIQRLRKISKPITSDCFTIYNFHVSTFDNAP